MKCKLLHDEMMYTFFFFFVDSTEDVYLGGHTSQYTETDTWKCSCKYNHMYISDFIPNQMNHA